MKLKRAILLGALLWVLIFFEISILMFGFKLTEPSIYITHYIISIILVSICSLLYFKNNKANAKEGIFLGITFIIIGLILDALITVPLFVKDYGFFLELYLWIGLIETLVITTILGALKSKIR